MDEKSGSQEIFSYLESRIERRENLLIDKIITTMSYSYSKVEKDSFPNWKRAHRRTKTYQEDHNYSNNS